jgi:AcrR family transcriptional regulator
MASEVVPFGCLLTTKRKLSREFVYDSEHKAKTRERLLEAAAAAIKVEGPERISIAAIMARALTHGGFYAHFGSKEELIAAAIQRMFEMVDRATQRRLEGLEPGRRWLTSLMITCRRGMSTRCRRAVRFLQFPLTWPDSAPI